MRIFKILALVVWFFALHNPAATQPTTLTLEEVIAQAMEGNHGIYIARKQAEITMNNAHPGNAGLLPRVDLSSGYNFGRSNAELEFAGNIPPSEIQGAQSQNLSASAGLTYRLFDGLGNIHNFDRLKLTGEMGRLQAQIVIENTVLQVAILFYNLLAVQQNIALLEEVVAASNQRLERAKMAADYGGSSLAVLQAGIDLAQDSNNLIQAILDRDQLASGLAVLMGREPINFHPVVVASSPVARNFSFEEMRTRAHSENIQLKVAGQNKQLAEKDLAIIRSSWWPTIDLNGSYGYNQSRNDAGIVLSNTSYGLNAGGGVNFNLFNGMRDRIRLQNAKIQLDISETQQQQQMLQMEADFQNAWLKWQAAQNMLSREEKNQEAAKISFQRSEEFFRLGTLTALEFRDAQLKWLSSGLQLTNAQNNLRLTELELLRISGRLLEE